MKTVLELKSLSKKYSTKGGNDTTAIDNLSLTIMEGEFVGIMGTSGSGKSTLLNLVATIDSPSAGNILLDGVDISNLSEKKLAIIRNKKIGIIFQDYNLLDTLTLYENIALSLIFQKLSHEKIQDKIFHISKELGIEQLLDKYPYEVSGGQRQRCACARAIVKNPEIVLADEPTGALDSKSSKVLLETLQLMNTKLTSTILMVTHDAIAASYCNCIYFLEDGSIFKQIRKGSKSKNEFYHEIIENTLLFGGGLDGLC